jgi:hypothetical protein
MFDKELGTFKCIYRLCNAMKSKYLEGIPVQGVFHHEGGEFIYIYIYMLKQNNKRKKAIHCKAEYCFKERYSTYILGDAANIIIYSVG